MSVLAEYIKVKTTYYIFHGRFPSEKAASIYTHNNAHAFAKLGMDATVVAPRRFGREKLTVQSYRTIYLPTIDLFPLLFLSAFAFWVSYIIFSISTFFYLLLASSRHALIVSNEALPLLLASFIRSNTLYEVHDFPESHTLFYRALFKRVQWVLVTNEWKKGEISRKFSVPEEKIMVEPNGVDLEQFSLNIEKKEARRKIGIPEEGDVVVYTGHLYSWKGVDVLAQAASDIPETDIYFVGGTRDGIQEFRQKYSDRTNIHVVGHKPHEEIPLWQKAADILVLPNTGKEEISVLYTSPMKLFEYMASGTTIIASKLPSIQEVVSEKEVYFVEPDSPRELANGILTVLHNKPEFVSQSHAAQALAKDHSWGSRVARILNVLMS